MNLSVAARLMWAKYSHVPTGSGQSFYEGGASNASENDSQKWWLPLVQHMVDSADVGGKLWDQWLSPHAKSVLAQPFRRLTNEVEGSQKQCDASYDQTPHDWDNTVQTKDVRDDTPYAQARHYLQFVCGVHDIGKATPPFVMKVPSLAQPIQSAGCKILPSEIDVSDFYHSLAGEAIIRRNMTRLFPELTSKTFIRGTASLIGAHHGVPTTDSAIREAEKRGKDLSPLFFGGKRWAEVQDELLKYMVNYVNVRRYFHQWNKLYFTSTELLIYSGLIIMADWIASHQEFYPLQPILNDTELVDLLDAIDDGNPSTWVDPIDRTEQRVRTETAWGALRLLQPWKPEEVNVDADELLRTRCGLPNDAVARPTQKALVDIVKNASKPALYLVEDVMGSGKTEAALMAAEVLAYKHGLQGMFVALPTMATTDSMFLRVVNYIDHLNQGKNVYSTALLHSKANLNDTYQQMVARWRYVERTLAQLDNMDEIVNDIGREYRQKHQTVTHRWMRGRKKSQLSDFAVTTVDHLLMCSLQSRHVMLRMLGVINKSVLNDEIHSATEFMNVYFERSLQWLGALGIPVIALSATLPPSLRDKLCRAYQFGAREVESAPHCSQEENGQATQRFLNPKQHRRAAARIDSPQEDALPQGYPYPIITVATRDKVTYHPVEAHYSDVEITIESCSSEQLVMQLNEQLKDGGCALVIKNTVKTAQETYRKLKNVFGDDVRLMHSRFVSAHRLANDNWLRNNFGPDTRKDDACYQRPYRSIIVATQVAEQSLDIDFDVLYTDTAPIDMLFQRIGRIHRHAARARPAAFEKPRCYILDNPLNGHEWSSPGGSAIVYSDYLLLKTALTLQRYIGRQPFRIPSDIPRLVAEVYDDDSIWEAFLHDVGTNVDNTTMQRYSDYKSTWESGEQTRINSAQVFVVPRPQRSTRTLNSFLQVACEADETEYYGQARVREGNDSIEVILIERVGDGFRLLPKVDIRNSGQDDVRGNEQIFYENDTPSWQLGQAMAQSMINLPGIIDGYGRYTDAVIHALEANFFPAWQDNKLLRGQLIIPMEAVDVESSLEKTPGDGLDVECEALAKERNTEGGSSEKMYTAVITVACGKREQSFQLIYTLEKGLEVERA